MDIKSFADVEPRANVVLAQCFQEFLGPIPADAETRRWLYWLWLEDVCGKGDM